MAKALLVPGNPLEAHCVGVALGRAGLAVSLKPGPDVDVVVVFARADEVPEHLPVTAAVGEVPLLLVCPVVDDDALRAAARIGAAAVIAWDGPTSAMVEAIDSLLSGEARAQMPAPEEDPLRDLTHRELQIAELIGRGTTNLAIAEALGISYHTVRTHVGHLMGKLDVTHRYAIVPLVQRSDRVRRMNVELPEAAAR